MIVLDVLKDALLTKIVLAWPRARILLGEMKRMTCKNVTRFQSRNVKELIPRMEPARMEPHSAKENH